MESAHDTTTSKAASRPSAFEQIFRPHMFASVERWLRRLGVPSCDRVDLVQDVFLAAFASFPSFDPSRGRPERWLNRITVHVAAHYRDRARHRREEPLPDDFDTDSGSPAPDDEMEAAEARKLVLDVLKSMGDEPCVIVVEHDLEGLSMTEVAERHRVPLSTAYKRRARGIATFQAAVHRALGAGALGDPSGEITIVAADRPSVPAAMGLASPFDDLPPILSLALATSA